MFSPEDLEPGRAWHLREHNYVVLNPPLEVVSRGGGMFAVYWVESPVGPISPSLTRVGHYHCLEDALEAAKADAIEFGESRQEAQGPEV